MSAPIGALYFMLLGIVIALVVTWGVVVSCRTQRTHLVAPLWIAIILGTD